VFINERLKDAYLDIFNKRGIIYFNDSNFQSVLESNLFDKLKMRSMSKTAIKLIDEHFSWDSIAKKHLELFAKITKRTKI
jgi:hypothetical protein